MVVKSTPTNLHSIKNKNDEPVIIHVNRCKQAKTLIEKSNRHKYKLRQNPKRTEKLIESIEKQN